MAIKTLLASALLLTATLAFLPSAEAAPPIDCVMAPCGPGDGDQIILPPVCGETINCQGPECPEVAVRTTDLFAFLGPSASVVLNSNCTVDVSVDGTPCPSLADPEDGSRSAGPVDVFYQSCRLNPDCTCDPLPIDLTTTAMAPPPGIQPPPQCFTQPCPPRVTCAEREIDGAYLFGVYIESNCEVTVGVIDGARICGFNGLEHYQVRQTVGLVTLVVNYCGVMVS